MRRGLGLVLCLGLLAGGAAACSDDDGATGTDGGAPTTPAPQSSTTAAGGTDTAGGDTAPAGGETTTSGDDTTTSTGDEPSTTSDDPVVAANDERIARFCAAKRDYDAALQAGLDNPDDFALIDRTRELSGVLSEASDELAPVIDTLTPEQAEQLRQCEEG